MSSSFRPKRPELDRSQPLRSWAGLFGATRNGAPTNGESPSNAAAPGQAIPRGVDLGYRVIEDYLRQGQEFARAAWPGLPQADGGGLDPRRLTERMYQYASDLMATWMQYLEVTMPQAPMPGMSPPASPPPTWTGGVGGFDIGGAPRPARSEPAEAPRPAPPAQESAPISIEVTSRHRVQVLVDLRPGSAERPLSAHDLRAADAGAPRIGGVRIERQGGELVVRLTVPDVCPAGTYSGLVVDDESNLPRGSLTVRVFGA